MERVYEDIDECIAKKSIHLDFDLSKMGQVIQKVFVLMGILVCVSFEVNHELHNV